MKRIHHASFKKLLHYNSEIYFLDFLMYKNYGYIEGIIAPDGEEQEASLDTFLCVHFIRAVYTADITFSLI